MNYQFHIDSKFYATKMDVSNTVHGLKIELEIMQVDQCDIFHQLVFNRPEPIVLDIMEKLKQDYPNNLKFDAALFSILRDHASDMKSSVPYEQLIDRAGSMKLSWGEYIEPPESLPESKNIKQRTKREQPKKSTMDSEYKSRIIDI